LPSVATRSREADATARRIASSIARSDYLRRSPHSAAGRRHKEWHHFVIFAPTVDVLVNFSVCNELRNDTPEGVERPRIVLLVREHGNRAHGWDGDVETFAVDDTLACGGRIDLSFRDNTLTFADGCFTIAAALQDRPIAVRLQLTPVTMPVFLPSIAMLDGPPLQWVVVPRLEASGTVTVGAREYAIVDAPAYHDHNWGYFLWGHDVAWEWGFVLPEERAVPWALTFVRLTNRARTVALEHKLLLWKQDALVRVFRERDLEVAADLEYLHAPRIFKVPRPMALVAPETAIDVPRGVLTRARAGDDWLECRCDGQDVAQVLIPSETQLGVTIFNELVAESSVHGCVEGEPVHFHGRSILEFIRVC
jgi:hypothetical protein